MHDYRQDYPYQPQRSQGHEPRRIGDVLAELLTQYQSRFPSARIAVLETRSFLMAERSAFNPPVASIHE